MNKTERISIDQFKTLQKGQKGQKRQNKEYLLCKELANYLKLQYPKVLYHFDLTGLNLSKVQAGMSKAIQHSKGWPDLFIAQPRIGRHNNMGISSTKGPLNTLQDVFLYSGLFIELKAERFDLLKKRPNTNGDYDYISDHVAEQAEVLQRLRDAGYKAEFASGITEAIKLIDEYLK